MKAVRATLPASLIAVAAFAAAAPAWAAGGTRQMDEATLREAGLETDGPALLEFFRKRTLDETDRSRLAATVRRLGDNSYTVREKASRDLIAADRSALPYLQSALKDQDLEIARRAQR